MPQFDSYAADLDMSFSRNAFSGDVNLLVGEAAIHKAVKSLILLKRDDKPFHPEINPGIAELLFENASPIIVGELTDRIQKAISRYEPRVMSSKVTVGFQSDKNTLVVKVMYTIRNIKKVFTTTVSVERTR